MTSWLSGALCRVWWWQCDQMVSLFFNIWSFAEMKITPICHKFAKVCSAFYQIRNRLSKVWQIFVNFCQNGEMPPNLVTLDDGQGEDILKNGFSRAFFRAKMSSRQFFSLFTFLHFCNFFSPRFLRSISSLTSAAPIDKIQPRSLLIYVKINTN